MDLSFLLPQFLEYCESGNLDAAKKIHQGVEKFGETDVYVNPYYTAFHRSCRHGHVLVAQWLYNSFNQEITSYCNGEWYRITLANICRYNQLEVAKWFITLPKPPSSTESNFWYRLPDIRCKKGDWAMTEPLFRAVKEKHLEIVKWLMTVHKYQDEFLDDVLPEELYEFAFSQGYIPVKNMLSAYRKKVFEVIKEKNTEGEVTVFEIRGLPELIADYV
jgi:hypothetical protein